VKTAKTRTPPNRRRADVSVLKRTAQRCWAAPSETVPVFAPLDEKTVKSLKAGDNVLLSGTIYVARDAAHKRLIQYIKEGKALPFNLRGAVIYYSGPTSAKPGRIIGSMAPTTSSRMDIYTPILLARGLKGMIGKGRRSPEVISAIKRYKAIYFTAIGGAADLLSKYVKKAKSIAFTDLGPEAILELSVENMPLIVTNDSKGGNFYERTI